MLAVRDVGRGEQAVQSILDEMPEAAVEIVVLDLADLASVRSFAESFRQKYDGLHLLINNAGVRMPPKSETADGFELQFDTDHIGHFALTGLLLEQLLDSDGRFDRLDPT